LFDPGLTKPLDLPVGNLVFGHPMRLGLLPLPDIDDTMMLAEDPNSLAERKVSESVQKVMDQFSSKMRKINSRLIKIKAIMTAGGKTGSSQLIDDLTEELKSLVKQQQKAKREAEDPYIRAQRERREMLTGRAWVDLIFGLVRKRSAILPRAKLQKLMGAPKIKSGKSTPEEKRKPGHATGDRSREKRPFVFVSTFKWEMRKGWDVLLQAYLEEFSSKDSVELYILTKPFADSGSDFKGKMNEWISKRLSLKDQNLFPSLYVISGHMTAEDYSGLYKSSDVYVIPTRGEGWGMPISEAMSMGLPVIVTNWSGTVDFVDDSVGYLIHAKLSPVPMEDDIPWWFKGARWADCSVAHLREIMRHVYNNRDEVAEKGRAARRLMHSKFSPQAVGKVIASEVQRIKDMVR
jgi:glycosyltransferase involved in cell wall biosynthesis